MNIKAISSAQINNISQTNFTAQKKSQNSLPHKNDAMSVKVPLMTLIAMSPLVISPANAQDPLPKTPEEVVFSVSNNATDTKTKVLGVKSFFNIGGENYIIKTKSTDGDDSNFEEITISQATPKSRGAHLKAKEVSKYYYAPLDDALADNGLVKIDGIKTEDIDSQKRLIGNEEFIEYIEDLANSPQNNGALEIKRHYELIRPMQSGRIISSDEEGNCWEDAAKYCPNGTYMGAKVLEGDNNIYTISIYNSDEQNLTAEEFTLKTADKPELKIDKMIKVKSNFLTDKEEPISFETYQFNLRDNNGAPVMIYDKTLGEYMEKVCKSVLYNKNDIPFEKAEVENDYKISASNGKVYLNK